MILKSLRLENIRSYISEKIEFSEGTILLSGDIGSGKSTILLAIEFALFGIQRAELSGDSLLRNGKAKGEVDLEFSIEGQEIMIHRTLKRQKDAVSQDSGYIIVNGKKFEGTPVELKSRIFEMLGYPSDSVSKTRSVIYRYTVYTPQEEMKYILEEDKELRLDTLRKVFGIDKYKLIRENAGLYSRELKRKIDVLKEAIADLDGLLRKKAEYEEKNSELLEGRAKSNASLAALQEKIAGKKAELEGLEKSNKEAESLHKKIAVLRARLSEKESAQKKLVKEIDFAGNEIIVLQDRLSSYAAIIASEDEEGLEQEVKKQEDECRMLELKASTLKGKKALCEEKIRTAMQEVSRAKEASLELQSKEKELSVLKEKLSDKDKVESERQELEKKLKMLSIKIAERKARKEDIRKSIVDLENLDICPKCLQKVEGAHKHEVGLSLARTIAEHDDVLAKLSKMEPHVNTSLEENRKMLEAVRKAEDNSLRLQSEISRLEKDARKIEELSSSLEKYAAEKRSLENEEKNSRDVSSLKEMISKKSILLKEMRLKNRQFAAKTALLESIAGKKKFSEEKKAELRTLDIDIENEKQGMDNINGELLKFSGNEKKIAEHKQQLDSSLLEEKRIEISLAQLSSQLISMAKDIREADISIDSKLTSKEKMLYYIDLRAWLDELFMNLMANIEKHILSSIYHEFNTLLKEWFAMLIDSIDIGLDEDFSVKIFQDGYETDFTNLSGGEKTSVALAYRLALNKVISDLIGHVRTKNLIILDEPTYGFSTEQLDKVREVFDKLDARQVIIVSHEQKMESFADKVIRVVKTENASRVIA